MTDQRNDNDPNGPSSRPAQPLNEGQKPDQLNKDDRKAETRQEALVDEAVEEGPDEHTSELQSRA